MNAINRVNDEWFSEMSDMNTSSFVKRQFVYKNSTFVEFAKHMQEVLRRTSSTRLYGGEVVGDRVQKVEIVENNVVHWMDVFALSVNTLYRRSQPTVYMHLFSRKTDEYGNPKKIFTVDFDSYRGLSGRMLLELKSELNTRMTSSKWRRWLVNKFPKFVNPLKETFLTSFDVTARLWFDPLHYIDITCYHIPVSDNIIIPLKSNTDEQREYDQRAQLFSARRSLSKCKNN